MSPPHQAVFPAVFERKAAILLFPPSGSAWRATRLYYKLDEQTRQGERENLNWNGVDLAQQPRERSVLFFVREQRSNFSRVRGIRLNRRSGYKGTMRKSKLLAREKTLEIQLLADIRNLIMEARDKTSVAVMITLESAAGQANGLQAQPTCRSQSPLRFPRAHVPARQRSCWPLPRCGLHAWAQQDFTALFLLSSSSDSMNKLLQFGEENNLATARRTDILQALGVRPVFLPETRAEI